MYTVGVKTGHPYHISPTLNFATNENVLIFLNFALVLYDILAAKFPAEKCQRPVYILSGNFLLDQNS